MIKNILFDLGGVLYHIAYIKTIKEFGSAISIRHLKELSQKKISLNNLNSDEEKELKNSINQLKSLYEKSVKIYDNSKN